MKREIKQLWYFAKHYFSLSTRLKRKIPKEILNKTPRDIANKYPNPSDARGNDKRVMLMTAHLSSCSVRLVTIDERIERNLGENNRIFPNYLNESKSPKTAAQLQTALLQNKDTYIHQMLRDNIAHIERSPHKNKQKENLFAARQSTLESLPFHEIYDSINKVVQRFKKELVTKNVLTIDE